MIEEYLMANYFEGITMFTVPNGVFSVCKT